MAALQGEPREAASPSCDGGAGPVCVRTALRPASALHDGVLVTALGRFHGSPGCYRRPIVAGAPAPAPSASAGAARSQVTDSPSRAICFPTKPAPPVTMAGP